MLTNPTKHFKKKKPPLILHNLLQKMGEEGTVPKAFFEASIMLIPKLKTEKRKLQTNVSHEHRHKNPQ